MRLVLVNWPAIVKYLGDDELTFIANEKAWQTHLSKTLGHLSEGDYLVDASAQKFELLPDAPDAPDALGSSSDITTDMMTALLRRHLSALNTCCVTKITLRSVEQGIFLVASTDES